MSRLITNDSNRSGSASSLLTKCEAAVNRCVHVFGDDCERDLGKRTVGLSEEFRCLPERFSFRP